jgi:hypothetical protein
MSDHLGRQRHDLHESLLAQLASHGTEDAGAHRLFLVVDDDDRILVETDVAAILAALFLDGADDDRLDDVALLDVAAGDRVLDGGDDVTDTGVTPLRATRTLST